ncbi:MAG: hypothetical protein OEX23_16830 [Betaproteobacteria bacterium]|nr:hypothetical protein [Betaproteobacteria bacterium]
MKRVLVVLLSLVTAASSFAADLGDEMVIPHSAATASRPSPKNYNVNGALDISGNVSWSMDAGQTTATATIERLTNNSSFNFSGTIQPRLIVTTAPIGSGGFTYWTIASFNLTPATLSPGQFLSNLVGTAPLLVPPDGIYYIHIAVFEFEPPGSCGNASSAYCMDDHVTFDNRVQVSGGVFSIYNPLPPLAPETGIWWNSNEPGGGYVLAVRNGVLVLSVYSYRPTGEPIWYLAAGATTNGNRNFSGVLTKYRFGQCISCTIHRSPLLDGDDGPVSIVFHSNTSATIYLPGGRASNIVPYVF